jgi:molecular chaperone HtpG
MADYAMFWEDFGGVLKEGLCESMAPREKILECCAFFPRAPRRTEAVMTLADYKANMREGQEAVYYLSGDYAWQALPIQPAA